jgi:hypothetical protein
MSFQVKDKPYSDFQMQQAAMDQVEHENRKFVKMVRIVREVGEDQPTYQASRLLQGSKPYLLDQESESLVNDRKSNITKAHE